MVAFIGRGEEKKMKGGEGEKRKRERERLSQYAIVHIKRD